MVVEDAGVVDELELVAVAEAVGDVGVDVADARVVVPSKVRLEAVRAVDQEVGVHGVV